MGPQSRHQRDLPRSQRHLLADVLPGEDLPAGFAFKAPQVPLLFQRQQRLPVFDISSAASTIWKKAAAHSYSIFVLLNCKPSGQLGTPVCPHLALNTCLLKCHSIQLPLPGEEGPHRPHPHTAATFWTTVDPGGWTSFVCLFPWRSFQHPVSSSWPGEYLITVSWL